MDGGGLRSYHYILQGVKISHQISGADLGETNSRPIFKWAYPSIQTTFLLKKILFVDFLKISTDPKYTDKYKFIYIFIYIYRIHVYM